MLANSRRPPAKHEYKISLIPKVSRLGSPATFHVLGEVGISQRFVLLPSRAENMTLSPSN